MSELDDSSREDRPAEVSVVIPTRGRPVVVQRAIRSALGQTFNPVEVLVVVDGDDPETLAAVESLNESRVRVIALPRSVGAAEARNIGVEAARGRWIAFLDDDDEWLPGKLERQLESAHASTARWPVVCSAYIGRSSEGDSLFGRRRPEAGEPISEYMFCRRSFSYGENALATSVLLVPRRLMLAVPFDRMLKRHQDWDWALRALAVAGTELCYVGEPLSTYSMTDGQGRMSGHNDWRYSLQWCRDRKSMLTPKARSFFIVTECMTRASEAEATMGEMTGLLKAYWLEGQPTLRSAMMAMAYLTVSKRVRRALLRLKLS